VRDILICHCDACIEAAGGPWAASAAAREDLTVVDETALRWERALSSECDTSRGFCRTCGTVVFWDAPGRPTASFAAGTLEDSSDLEVAGEIWLGETPASTAAQAYSKGLPASVITPWRR
jgi:hypothetical protein